MALRRASRYAAACERSGKSRSELKRVSERTRSLLRLLPALVRDGRIPRSIRWLLVIGLLPIPGPFDEAVGLVALGLIAVFYRGVLRDIRSDQHERPGSG